jgi:HAE1 family hydrophobic/amphiphilic exporter-1
MVPLHAVAGILPRVGPSSISRIDQERVMRVSATPTGRPLGDITEDLEAKLANLTLPDGFSVSVEGESAEQDATFRNLLLGIVLSLFLVFSVMAVQFESLKQPLIVMVSVPFALTGVCASLLLTETTFNMYSFLGTIVLVGIVVNNAIVLLDYANLMRNEEGMSVRDALIAAGQRRLRPILMTTLTTLLGLVPLALGLGEGSEMQAPMARAIVGGLLSSTIVTLFLVPAVYFVVERGSDKHAHAP